MDAWELALSMAEVATVGVVLMVIIWAARERGRIHTLARLHDGAREEAAAFFDTCFDKRWLRGVLQAARHAWRLHVATCAVAGWA
jgi:hypothetical protein